MRVALVGPPQSGKSTLFAAVAEAGGSEVHLSRPDQPHLAVVKVPDERITWLAEHYNPKKTTEAELEFLDLPGIDLSDQAGRDRAKAQWTAMRGSDMLVFVVRTEAGQDLTEPAHAVGELLIEMLLADLEQVTNRIEKLEATIRKPTADREQNKRELALMNRLSEVLEAEKPIAEVVASDSEAKILRSFAFLSQKPVLVVLNCSEDAAGQAGPGQIESQPCIMLSAQIEQELAELDPEERGEFLAEMDLAAPARDRMIRACYDALKLVSFLTVGADECRAWSVPAGTTAVEAAAEIHSDIARGFIRAELVAYDDLHAAGDMKAAKAAGKVRLEGKTYLVSDGDVINFRFNV